MLIAGIDEAGRGPVIGPMVMSIVVIDSKYSEKLKKIGVKDSKLLSKEDREKLYLEIKKIANEIHTIKINANEIDKKRLKYSLNEIEAKISIDLINKLKTDVKKIYIDCPQLSTEKYKEKIYAYLENHYELIVENKADFTYPIVSAASIIAKVERDFELNKIEKKYNLKLGCGYPHDKDTLNAINKLEKVYPNFIRKSWQTYIDLKNKEKQKTLF